MSELVGHSRAQAFNVDHMSGDSAMSGRGAGIGCAVAGFFGSAWFAWGMAEPTPTAVTWVLQVGAILALAVGVGGIVVAIRSAGGSDPMSDPTVRCKYWQIVALEFGLIVIGALLLGAAGMGEWVPVWVCAVVGVHFVPLASVFRAEPLKVVGAALVVVAAVALIVGLATSAAPSTIAGAGAGSVLLVAGALGLIAQSGRAVSANPSGAPRRRNHS